MQKQHGVSMIAFLMISGLLVFVLIIGMKLTPAYLEFFSVKKAIGALKGSVGGTPTEIRKTFDKYAQIDDFTAVSGKDLEIDKSEISVEYSKKVELFGNLSACMDFKASTADGQ